MTTAIITESIAFLPELRIFVTVSRLNLSTSESTVSLRVREPEYINVLSKVGDLEALYRVVESYQPSEAKRSRIL